MLARSIVGVACLTCGCGGRASAPPRFGRAILDDATASRAALTAAIDAHHGLIEVDYYEGGGVQRHERVCGEALARRIPSLAAELQDERARWADFDVACTDVPTPICVFNPGEVLPHGTRYLFVADAVHWRLHAIVRFQAGALDTTAQDAFIATSLAAAAATTCP